MQRLLLVDDDPGIRQLFAVYLGRSYEVTCVPTAARALALLSAQEPDLAIVDYRLPDRSGLELLREIKSRFPRLPVIVITGCGSESVCASALKLGARDYFSKPFDPAAVFLSIQSILSHADGKGDGRQNALAGSTGGPAAPAGPLPATPGAIAIRQAVRYIQEHYSEPLSLQVLARHVGMSKFTLCRKFKAEMGVSFRGYLLHLRLNKARELLQSRQYSVTEVAHIVGFHDLPHFDKAFKRATGVSPSKKRANSAVRAITDNSPATDY